MIMNEGLLNLNPSKFKKNLKKVNLKSQLLRI